MNWQKIFGGGGRGGQVLKDGLVERKFNFQKGGLMDKR